MRLSIKNTGKILQADIEINGITVIAGENNTGKSTVGKILFCIFNSFYKIDQQIEKERKNSIERIITTSYFDATNRLTRKFDTDEIAEQIMHNRELYFEDKKRLKEDLRNLYIQADENFEKHLKDVFLVNVSDKISQIFNVSDEEIFATEFRKKLQGEFNMQLNNVNQPNLPSQILLQIKDTEVKVTIKENENIEIKNNISLNTEVIYMDDPLALDNLRFSPMNMYSNNNYTTHREHLRAKLLKRNDTSSVKDAIDEIIATKKLDALFEKLNSVCKGEIIRKGRPMLYKENDSESALDLMNISTGLKTFIILKTLLLNGSLEENGTIVLDEPEIHLHPEWQLVFAELIVLIQKEFSMHILLNTHSPYFLDAIDVFSHKYGISDKCKYYLAENVGEVASITDVSDEIEKIYAKLSRPLQVLENVRYEND